MKHCYFCQNLHNDDDLKIHMNVLICKSCLFELENTLFDYNKLERLSFLMIAQPINTSETFIIDAKIDEYAPTFHTCEFVEIVHHIKRTNLILIRTHTNKFYRIHATFLTPM